MWNQGQGRSIGVHTGKDPHAADAPLAPDAIVQHARRGGLDGAPVAIGAGVWNVAGGVCVEEEGHACGA